MVHGRKSPNKLLMGEGGGLSGQLEVVSIVGFGGLGKTTLANQVYSKIKNEFQCSAFVSVSRTPDMSKILKDILFGVQFPGKEIEDDVQKLINILRAQLTNKMYMFVYDLSRSQFSISSRCSQISTFSHCLIAIC